MDGKLHIKALKHMFLDGIRAETWPGQGMEAGFKLGNSNSESFMTDFMNDCPAILHSGGNEQTVVAGTFWALLGMGRP